MAYAEYEKRVLGKSKKPKRILAVDGGGIRGLITIQFLRKIEEIVRKETKNPDALLRDYFHLVGGTSTGSVIAALTAMGRTADQMEEIYRRLGKDVFKRNPIRHGLLRAKYDSKVIANAIKSELGDITMEDTTRAGIGFCAVTKRLDTSSAWPIDNNPRGKYFGKRQGRTTVPNKDYKVSQVIRASTAAPTFFDPELIQISKDVRGLFVDGGVSPHNNPALQLLMLATISGYGYNWEVGENKIFVVSLGTGFWATELDNVVRKARRPAAANGIASLASLMNDTRELNELMMQWLGKATGPVGDIDRVVGNLTGESLCDSPRFSYMRYNIEVEKEWLEKNIGGRFTKKKVKALQDLGDASLMDEYADIGKIYADNFIKKEHLIF